MATSSSDWQESFVATNLIALGYNAWSNYLAGGRGAVICSLNLPQLNIAGETFRTHYVVRSRLAAFLNAWLAFPDTIILNHHHINGHILQAVDSYNPETDLVLLLESGAQAAFLYLRALPISPPKSYQVVCRIQDEFRLEQPNAAELGQSGIGLNF